MKTILTIYVVLELVQINNAYQDFYQEGLYFIN